MNERSEAGALSPAGFELDFERLKHYGADFTGITTFEQWQQYAFFIAQTRKRSGLWLADCVAYIHSRFGYERGSGLLRFIQDDEFPDDFQPPTFREIADWMGYDVQSIYNVRDIASTFPLEVRKDLQPEGVYLGVSHYQASRREGLTPAESVQLVAEYVQAKVAGGYADNHEKPGREAIRQRAVALQKSKQNSTEPTARGKVEEKPLKKTDFWIGQPVPSRERLRLVARLLGIDPDSLPDNPKLINLNLFT